MLEEDRIVKNGYSKRSVLIIDRIYVESAEPQKLLGIPMVDGRNHAGLHRVQPV